MAKETRTLPVGNRNAGTYDFAPKALEPDLVGWRLNLIVLPFAGKQFPFDAPTDTITIKYEFSWDGGVTYPSSVTATKTGKPDGVWNPLDPNEQPYFRVTIPTDSERGGKPNFYKASATLSARITLGAELIEI